MSTVRQITLCLVPILLLSITHTTHSEDWTQFRGPDQSGVAPAVKLPSSWSADSNMAWRTQLPGHGTSSPITLGDKIYLTSFTGYGNDENQPGDPDDLKLHLICLSLATGEIEWEKSRPAPNSVSRFQGFQALHGYASSTPATDGEMIYAFFGNNGVHAYTLEGEHVWESSVGDGTHGWGSANSPVLFNDLVIVNASVESGAIVALNKKSGEEVWRAGGIRSSWNSPVLGTAASGRRELLISSKNEVLAFNPQTGDKLWTAPGVQDYVCPTVAVNNGVAYIIGGRKNTGIAVALGGDGEVEPVWTNGKGSNVSSPIYYEGHLYFVNESRGVAYCVNAKSGETVYEERLSPRPGRIYASPIVADGKIFVSSQNEGVFVLAAKPEFELISHNSPLDDSVFNATPAVADGKLLLRSQEYLYAITAK